MCTVYLCIVVIRLCIIVVHPYIVVVVVVLVIHQLLDAMPHDVASASHVKTGEQERSYMLTWIDADSDNDMGCHRLDDMAHPLTCHVIVIQLDMAPVSHVRKEEGKGSSALKASRFEARKAGLRLVNPVFAQS
ncbi:uncharacterized protein LACBIDRAFT_327870 [Laccaria bicolor S238N-H82]|uniref:Predicted protein n=1 Tax=Laccaria bicolor (strain S238N-H82 / ATCC MYA-4686) TaxID=486041 RepID=B0DD20_LACBS|nr:uncharacterized protein LACBIDRAFT_327870 [Laccaria bicolor S238N-H82]EDR07396.1 predicted protein [Laccaria bicolor S238N-H82]|eukprot:XP_001881788.1 predicted protein [Laccaria bicolor S238N-H82]